jgi:hypothetical protein
MKKNLLILGILGIFIVVNFQAPVGLNKAVASETIIQTNVPRVNPNFNTANLPSYFSWRDINGVDYTTDIRNQAPFASCEAFAIVAAIETMVQYKVGFPFGCDLSEAHLFFNSNGSQLGWGTYPESDLRYLQKYGIPDEACWPYPKKKALYPPNTSSPDWQNRTVKITNWSYLPNNINAIKSALINNGPVPAYLNKYEDFNSYSGTVNNTLTGHTNSINALSSKLETSVYQGIPSCRFLPLLMRASFQPREDQIGRAHV